MTSVIALASISICRFPMLRFFARTRPSLRPQSSATMGRMKPMDLVKLAIQDPLWSLISSPVATKPRFPLAEPLVLSLKKQTGGGGGASDVGSAVLDGSIFFVGIRCHMYWARDLAFIEIAWVEKGIFSMKNLLWAVQMHQAVKGEMMCQGMVLWFEVWGVEDEMSLSQLGRSRVKKLWGMVGFKEFCQMVEVYGQSRRMWMVDSADERQRGQESLDKMWRLRSWFFVERRSWNASQRNVLTWGKVWDFQSQFQLGVVRVRGWLKNMR